MFPSIGTFRSRLIVPTSEQPGRSSPRTLNRAAKPLASGLRQPRRRVCPLSLRAPGRRRKPRARSFCRRESASSSRADAVRRCLISQQPFLCKAISSKPDEKADTHYCLPSRSLPEQVYTDTPGKWWPMQVYHQGIVNLALFAAEPGCQASAIAMCVKHFTSQRYQPCVTTLWSVSSAAASGSQAGVKWSLSGRPLRKLLHIAFGVLKTGTPFVENHRLLT